MLASGVAALQVAATPFAVSLGPVETAASRLTFCSSINSVGTTLASALGMGVFMAALVKGVEEAVGSVQLPYMMIGGVALLLAMTLRLLPKQADEKSTLADSCWQDLLSHRTFLYGVVAIFCYVGARWL
ncbi:hypothetical protein LRP52_29335 [Photobacterium sp. ZSDE20]|uniref:Major facilitator superfamily (MFS) profile domain-containing protein n=1 Tax=Photobacterium pectinilyticum TaxID=2906793 RepID=A0ABT1N1N5_9GAMM|nr:hypothetical protein [Photobacterium sp. ZSDE20]MCQ1058594.1 hypothetical protein [Photobacterium sp. ZSDE20]MDD1826284.1 hypothetical protein [Photobacterium sp. ZSDE20]